MTDISQNLIGIGNIDVTNPSTKEGNIDAIIANPSDKHTSIDTNTEHGDDLGGIPKQEDASNHQQDTRTQRS